MWITDWTTRAACKGTDPNELFVQGAAQERAKMICRGCAVRTECLADALDNGIEFGVWGGMTERERRALLRRRPDITCWRDLLEAARDRYEQSEQSSNVLDLRKDPAEESSESPEFKQFYEGELRFLIKFLLNQGVPYHDALDKAQAAFMEAYQQWTKIKNPRAWIRTVALRVNHQPRERPLHVVPSDYEDPLPSNIELKEQTHFVHETLRRLPPTQRTVMAWTIDGFKPKEIAEHLDCEPEAVRKNLERARQNLKRALVMRREEVI